jgi:hypothetical protein
MLDILFAVLSKIDLFSNFISGRLGKTGKYKNNCF